MRLVPALWFFGLYGKEITLFLIELCDLFAIVSERQLIEIKVGTAGAMHFTAFYNKSKKSQCPCRPDLADQVIVAKRGQMLAAS